MTARAESSSPRFRSSPLCFIIQSRDDLFSRAEEIECTQISGDCMFDCLALWLNLHLDTDVYSSGGLRLLVAKEVNEMNFQHVLYDVASGGGGDNNNVGEAFIAAHDTVEKLRFALVNPGRVWGSHSTLLLALKVMSRKVGASVAAVVISKDYATPTVISPHENEDDDPPAVGCVLHFIPEFHYTLIGRSPEEEEGEGPKKRQSFPLISFDFEDCDFVPPSVVASAAMKSPNGPEEEE